ncbi:XRE family transcriptional regulator [Rhizobium lentis]|nr:XRE family transcriptional regulator [Rhizobium lentis]
MTHSETNAILVTHPSDMSQSIRTDLRGILARVVADKGLSQTRTAKLCSTDQPTLSKVLSGRSDSVSADQLLRWLVQLGCEVDIEVRYAPDGCPGSIGASFDE